MTVPLKYYNWWETLWMRIFHPSKYRQLVEQDRNWERQLQKMNMQAGDPNDYPPHGL